MENSRPDCLLLGVNAYAIFSKQRLGPICIPREQAGALYHRVIRTFEKKQKKHISTSIPKLEVYFQPKTKNEKRLLRVLGQIFGRPFTEQLDGFL